MVRSLSKVLVGVLLMIATACGGADAQSESAAADGEGADASVAAPTTAPESTTTTAAPTTTTAAPDEPEEPEEDETAEPSEPPRRQEHAVLDLLTPGNPEIEGTLITFEATDDEVDVVVSTRELVPGNPVTMWVVALRDADCKEAFPEIQPCQPWMLTAMERPDLGNVHYLGGGIPDADGALTVAGRVTHHGRPSETPDGEIGWWFETDIGSFRDAVVHIIVHDHGPPIDGIVEEMWTTYRGGCTVESLGPGNPENALNDGPGGRNTCVQNQAAPFLPAATNEEDLSAAASDVQQGSLSVDPGTVATTGPQELTITGSDWLPNTEILIVPCIAPGEPLVYPDATDNDVLATQSLIDPIQHCRLGEALTVAVGSNGTFTEALIIDVSGQLDLNVPDGTNFFLGAGTLDGSQAGSSWVPVVPNP